MIEKLSNITAATTPWQFQNLLPAAYIAPASPFQERLHKYHVWEENNDGSSDWVELKARDSYDQLLGAYGLLDLPDKILVDKITAQYALLKNNSELDDFNRHEQEDELVEKSKQPLAEAAERVGFIVAGLSKLNFLIENYNKLPLAAQGLVAPYIKNREEIIGMMNGKPVTNPQLVQQDFIKNIYSVFDKVYDKVVYGKRR